MKILWFTWKDRDNPLAGGAEVVNEELARRLVAGGHEVVFFVAGFPDAMPSTNRHGFRVVRVGSRFTSYLAAVREYRARWQGWPDLVIDECNTMPFFARFYTSGRQVLFFHMLCREIWFHEFPQPLSTLGYLLEPLYLRLLSHHVPVITVSRSTQHDLQHMGFKPHNIHVISEGIELTPVKSLGSIKKFSQPTLLSLGAMRSMKRTLHQIQAFELAKSAHPNLKLIVAGDSTGHYGQKVLEHIAKSSHSKDIQYLGKVTKDKKIELMQKAHLILVTSVKEGWGLIVTEAGSQGTPAIVYDVDGLRDAVRPGQTGLITQPKPAAMAAAVASLLNEPDRYQQLRTAAWEWSRTITFDRSYADFTQALGLAAATVSNRSRPEPQPFR